MSTDGYRKLVKDRKECHKCRELGLTNPADGDCKQFDGEHIGPWTAWQGSPKADLMIVGQEWGSVTNFIDQGGRDCGGAGTNKRLRRLLLSIGIATNPPGWPGSPLLYFTNAVLCLKGEGNVQTDCFDKCVSLFLGEQINLVAPKVVVTLGGEAYNAVMRRYERQPRRSMTAAVEDTTFECIGRGKSVLVPVFHPSPLAVRNRSEQQQIEDWKRVEKALLTPVAEG